MAKIGTVSAISIEEGTISIQDGQYTNKYSFTHPYISNNGRNMDKGAATFMKEVPVVGQSIEYSYGSDNGIQFLKFLKVVEGAAQGNPAPFSAPQPKPPSQYSGAPKPASKSFDSPEKQQMIYRQHAEKLFSELYSANPELLDTQDGGLTTDVAFISQVANNADIMVQRFCVTYGLSYINKSN